jgi:hypothetical protein
MEKPRIDATRVGPKKETQLELDLKKEKWNFRMPSEIYAFELLYR